MADKKKNTFMDDFFAGFKTKAARAGARPAKKNLAKFGDTADEVKKKNKSK